MKAVALLAAAVFGLPVVMIGAAAGGLGAEGAALEGWPAWASDVPPEMAVLYDEAGARFGVPPALLAAVGKVECDHNRHPACATPNGAGAVGPMQFLPTTFAAWSWASGSPAPSVLDPRDAVFAAAAKLAADGAATDPSAALFSYNPSAGYVATVEAWALAYGWAPPDPVVLRSAVLDHPRLSLGSAAAADVADGIVEDRLLVVLLLLATRHDLGGIGPFATGHGYYVRGTRTVSNHVHGGAVDVFVVDDRAVDHDNMAARDIVGLLLALPSALRPDEIGCPWPDLEHLPGVFSDRDHSRHLHIGFEAQP